MNSWRFPPNFFFQKPTQHFSTFNCLRHTMWGPKTIAKLVQTTPITLVYDAQVTIPMLQGAGIFTNICPCPKSPSFVGKYTSTMGCIWDMTGGINIHSRGDFGAANGSKMSTQVLPKLHRLLLFGRSSHCQAGLLLGWLGQPGAESQLPRAGGLSHVPRLHETWWSEGFS